MASINLVVEQVNHQAEDIEHNSCTTRHSSCAMDNALGAVVDPNTDFIRRTPAVNDGLSDCEDGIEEDRPSSTETVTETEDSTNHNVQKPEVDIPTVHRESLKAQAIDSRPSPVAHSDEGISDMTYPQISYPVAQYLFETNPGLTEKMEKILISRGSSQTTTPSQSTNASPSHTKSSKSSLSSLAGMTDALALQQSTIGNARVPAATPAQVVDAINKIQSDKKLAEKNYRRVHAEVKMEQKHNVVPVMKNAMEHPAKKDLVPYPPDRITKVIQKNSSSWFGSSTSNDKNTSNGKSLQRSQSHENSNSSSSSNHGPVTNSVDSGYSPQGDEQNNSVNSREDVNYFSLDSNRYSDRLETSSNISNYSERLEVMSNISGVSGFEEEMFRIRKLLIEAPSDSNVPTLHSQSQKSPVDKTINVKTEFSAPINVQNYIDRIDRKPEVKDKCNEANENDGLLFQLQREKANLEGKIEVMQNEMETNVDEKARMQATLASLQSQLKAQITSTQNSLQEKEMAEQELEKIVKVNRDWNSNVNQLQSEIEKHEIEAKLLKEEMDEVQNEKSLIKVQVEELKVDLETREGTIDGLKKKIAELHVGLQTMHQTNVQIQNDQSSMQSEVAALNKSKSWYQHQLHSVQEERGQLQQNLMESQTKAMSYCNEMEKLRCEAVQLKQQVVETQHRAMREKEVLMHHLETIEADMLEREITFEQLQKDRGNLEEGLLEKLKKVEEDKSKLNDLVFKVSDLTNQLEATKSDLQFKEAALDTLERDQLSVSQELMLKDKDINAKNLFAQQLENQIRETNLKVKQLQHDLNSKDEQYSTLKTEKTNIEVALVSANNEKKEVTDALSSLKMNLSKVESNFKLMKAEVVRKSSELEKCQREKDRLQTNLESVEQNLAAQRQEFESQVCMDSQQRGLIVGDLKRQKTELEKVLNVLRIDLRKSQTDQSKLENSKSELEQQLQEVRHRWNETNNTLQNVLEEKQFLEGRLQTRERQSLVRSPADDHDLYKNRAKELQSTLDRCRADFNEKQRTYKTNIKVLMKKLRQLREKAEKEMKLRIEAEKLEIMNGDLGDADEMKVLNDRLMKEIEDYKSKVSQCEENLEDMTVRYKQQKHIAEQNHRLALDLEREKGRLAGVTQNHSALKQHTSHLEATLAQRESVVSELDYISKETAERQRYDEAKLHEKIVTLEEALNKEKSNMKELRKQLFQDKRENSNLKHHIKSIKEALEGANQQSDLKKLENLKLKSELEVKIQAELKHRSEIEAMHTELKKAKAEIDRLSRAVEESNARDPVLTQQMRTLTWHLKQKNDELSSMKEQLKLLQDTHNSELNATKSMLQNAESVAEQLRMELAEVRKEKFNYQAKVNDLRTALKASLDQNKKMISKFNQIQKSSAESLPQNFSLPDSPTPYDDSYVNQLLEQSISVPQTRPLSNLKTCLNALKMEVGDLMKQLKVEESADPSSPISVKDISSSSHNLQSGDIETV